MDRDNQRDKLADGCPECGGMGEVRSFGSVKSCDHAYARDKRLEEIRNHVERTSAVIVKKEVAVNLLEEIDLLQGERDKAIEGLREVADESSHEDACVTKINGIVQDTLKELGVNGK
ncbi:hypothetical protein D3P07_11500 [Paenibacillus sp. 1011MAR3C5]|uniref:hypothetical protein n=1 Tax=Paenibacillus sp. 1011MAR3C5 TaxID=1675787 RepID=UPI000E6D1714|nr:hypothetical protein [Paenibacillus sp. 1011MAR3C5]RJE88613.1 hypothetical protein D3P07_11500 [Paenibacillus sp. 1011MAR3C5]